MLVNRVFREAAAAFPAIVVVIQFLMTAEG
jgi:hypothetical protein